MIPLLSHPQSLEIKAKFETDDALFDTDMARKFAEQKADGSADDFLNGVMLYVFTNHVSRRHSPSATLQSLSVSVSVSVCLSVSVFLSLSHTHPF